ncbi:MAG: restriction endonuclease [Arenimonas sp.]|nr:restriction endonuclease [Arenimonas sp.]MBP7917188.1 restriction endonuclease [Arenimonas sp.]
MKGLKNNRKRWNDDLALIPWDQFEKLLAGYYSKLGYRVEHIGTGSGSNAKFDGGIDLKLYKDGRYTVVQCKHWNVKQVPHNEVHQLIGLMVTEKADAGILVTSGEYTTAARQAAAKHDQIELIDGLALRQILGEDIAHIRHARDSDYIPRHMDDGRNQTVEHAPRQPGNRRRNAKPKKTMFHAVLIFALPLIFIFVIVKLLPSFITIALKKPEPANSPAEVVQKQMPAGHQIPSVRTLHVESSSAQIGSADEMMTPEELNEWKRQNKESMEILEKRVPELRK